MKNHRISLLPHFKRASPFWEPGSIKAAAYTELSTPDQAYVYILSSSFKRLYTGVTTRLMHRVLDHKTGRNPGSFTSRYRIDKLVYYECHASIHEAIARETEIKGWLRLKKVALIVALNPTWRDLSADWGKPTEPFDEGKMRRPVGFSEE